MIRNPKVLAAGVLAFVGIVVYVTMGQPVGVDPSSDLPGPGDPVQIPVSGEEATPIVMEKSGWKWEICSSRASVR